MKFRKTAFSFMLTVVMTVMLLAPVQVHAATPGQAKTASSVKYGRVSAADSALIRAMFDAEYYAANNTDVVGVQGNNAESLFRHFITAGIFEGRACNSNFNVSAYRSSYDDLDESYHGDIVSYYLHYLKHGKWENRTLTTVEKAIEAGKTVRSAVDTSDVVARPAPVVIYVPVYIPVPAPEPEQPAPTPAPEPEPEQPAPTPVPELEPEQPTPAPEPVPDMEQDDTPAFGTVSPYAELTMENALALLDVYDPDGAFILRNTPDSEESILKWLTDDHRSNTIEEAIPSDMDTAVHESCHGYTSYGSSGFYNNYTGNYMRGQERIYIGSGESVIVEMTPGFDSKEIVPEVPEELRTYRFDTYIDTDDDLMASRQHGVYGLLNEFTAYCWGNNNTDMLYRFMVEKRFGSPYLSHDPGGWHEVGNYFSYAEFRYYILKYILYAKEHYLGVYDAILANDSFRKAFTAIDTKFKSVVDFYREHFNIGAYENQYQVLMAEMEKEEYTQLVERLKP